MAVSGANVLVASLERTDATARVVAALKQQFAGAGLEVIGWAELNPIYADVVAPTNVSSASCN